MSFLAELLEEHQSPISEHLFVPNAEWARLITRTNQQERDTLAHFSDEQAWTFLLACGYAMAGGPGVVSLARQLTDSDPRARTAAKIWFEARPVPPRYKEGSTRLDLALGSIVGREPTQSGIALDPSGDAWICFCEMKWNSDVQPRVTNDMQRNQLARVTENALCFQDGGKYAQTIHVTLVTPAVFRESAVKSRLYQYKYEEYTRDGASILKDLNASDLEHRNRAGWVYPSDMEQRIRKLSLHWATYDDLFENLPDSSLSQGITTFWGQYGSYQGRA